MKLHVLLARVEPFVDRHLPFRLPVQLAHSVQQWLLSLVSSVLLVSRGGIAPLDRQL